MILDCTMQYIYRYISDLLHTFIAVYPCCRFEIPLNKGLPSFLPLMWTAVVDGASVAMVTLLVQHGGSPFVSRSVVNYFTETTTRQ